MPMQPPSSPGAPPGEGSLVLAHDSRKFDGHFRQFQMYVRALEDRQVHPQLVTCVDPSIRDEYPALGTILEGRHILGGGQLEMGYNRLFPVFTRPLGRIPGRLLHVNDVYLAATARFRPRVIVSVADLAKAYTHFYPRMASWIHNRNLPYLRQAAAVVCHSAFVRDELRTYARVDEDRIHIVPLYSLLPPLADRDDRSPAPPTETAPWNLLYVATDRPHKNIPFFLEILAQLGPRFRGTLVSQLGPATQKRVAQLSLQPRLAVLTDVSRMEEIFGQAHVFVFPSRYEGFGIPLVEAMASGIPVVAGARAAIPETVGDGGQIVPTEDVRPWCEAVERLTEPVEYRRWSEKARRRSEDFGPSRAAEALLRAYETVT